MNKILCLTTIVAVFGVFASAELSFDTASSVVEVEDALWIRIPKMHVILNDVNEAVHSRSRRSEPEQKTHISGGGGHGKGGTDISIQGQTRVWQSPNGRNEIHAHGQYGQHFGGPGGRSPPSVGGGIIFRRRF